MKESIPIVNDEDTLILVNSHKLYKLLETKDNYNDWFEKMSDCGLIEDPYFVKYAMAITRKCAIEYEIKGRF